MSLPDAHGPEPLQLQCACSHAWPASPAQLLSKQFIKRESRTTVSACRAWSRSTPATMCVWPRLASLSSTRHASCAAAADTAAQAHASSAADTLRTAGSNFTFAGSTLLPTLPGGPVPLSLPCCCCDPPAVCPASAGLSLPTTLSGADVPPRTSPAPSDAPTPLLLEAPFPAPCWAAIDCTRVSSATRLPKE